MEDRIMANTEKLILEWAAKRGILFPENARNQLLKSFEEMGELARAVLHSDVDKIKDSIGDTLVTLAILANAYQLDLNTCLKSAWLEIKDRKGETVNGTFIKNENT